MSAFDVAVVGAGPNGLSAAIQLARSGHRPIVIEAADTIGGGTRTEELTLPGFHHDVCSAIHPAAVASPFFTELGLQVDWVHSPIPFSHPLDDGRSVALHRSLSETADSLGDDAETYKSLMLPFVENIDEMVEASLSPVTLNPRHKGSFARLAGVGGMPAAVLANRFETEEAKALIAGMSAHAVRPFHAPTTAAVGLMLGAIGHTHGWPMARGGSGTIAEALATILRDLGGVIETGHTVSHIDEMDARVVLLDVMPPAASSIAGSRIGPRKARRLARWQPGAGVFKIDWALSGPIPWSDPLSRRAATVHVGGTYAEIASAEKQVGRGEHPRRPFVLLAQQSLFDQTRAPEGKHTAWAYCHVPNGSRLDMTGAIESQVERFAPGFDDLIIERATHDTAAYESHNVNYVGGDIGGGVYGMRKVLQLGERAPYLIGDDVYLCSSATPPGAGVHGMCGYHAARAVGS